MVIIINGEEFEIGEGYISYSRVIRLAGYGPDQIVSVTYSGKRNGDYSHRSGMLSPKKEILLEDGMRFSAFITGDA